VFPSSRAASGRYVGLPQAWTRIIKPLDGFSSLTPHGLRHAFASVADDLGYTEATIAAMLGHSHSGTTRGYIHKLDLALVAAADRVSQRIADMLAGTAVRARMSWT
jgi:integrase